MNIKGHSDEVLDGNEKHISQHWRKDAPCCTVAKNSAKLHPGI